MKTSRLFFVLIATIVLLHAAAASADAIDMDDPRRTVGREGDVRVDAQLVQNTVFPGSPIGITWQIENLSKSPIAVADRIAAASYDADTRTITVAVGSEVPHDGRMPRIVTIAPGEKKLFRSGATPVLAGARTPLVEPRYVQVKVSILRDVAAFEKVVAEKPLPDDLFDKWFEANDTIFLNAVPVHFSGRRSMNGFASADQRGNGHGM